MIDFSAIYREVADLEQRLKSLKTEIDAVKNAYVKETTKIDTDLKGKIYQIITSRLDEDMAGFKKAFGDSRDGLLSPLTVISPDDAEAVKYIRFLKAATKMTFNVDSVVSIVAYSNYGFFSKRGVKKAYCFCEDALYYIVSGEGGNLFENVGDTFIKIEYNKIEDCRKAGKVAEIVSSGDTYTCYIKHEGKTDIVDFTTALYDIMWELIDLSRSI